jgi:hypothetical protein
VCSCLNGQTQTKNNQQLPPNAQLRCAQGPPDFEPEGTKGEGLAPPTVGGLTFREPLTRGQESSTCPGFFIEVRMLIPAAVFI